MQDLLNIIDTHSHYDDPRFDGLRDELIAFSFQQGDKRDNSCRRGLQIVRIRHCRREKL